MVKEVTRDEYWTTMRSDDILKASPDEGRATSGFSASHHNLYAAGQTAAFPSSSSAFSASDTNHLHRAVLSTATGSESHK
ncbi:unnamed protein product [Nippostrongylus brasiliensis]|uniref:Uncharacterized protein n=1 Tax=Nippostrongylus brasiliensis TaxID=27835 RepID=A0A0N4YHW3_NIPBR|nr:unnamed protein product [Nippostrongylus brasiliensis]